MGKLGEAVVEVRADTRQLDAGLAGGESKAKAFVGKTNAILGGLGALAVGAAAGGAAAFLADAAKKASDLGETISKVETVFGNDSKLITAAADDMAERFGLVKRETIDAATAFGLMGSAAGLTGKDAATLGVNMMKLAGDVSSFLNLPMDVALEKLRSGLAGEAEPLRALGVFLTEDAVKAEALRRGLVKSGEALSEQAKILARVSLIKKAPSMAKASGDLERTMDSSANQLRKLEGDLENFKTEFGKNLIAPMIEGIKLAHELGAGLASALGNNGDALGETLKNWITAIRLMDSDVVSNTFGQFISPMTEDKSQWHARKAALQAKADADAGLEPTVGADGKGLRSATLAEAKANKAEIARRNAAARASEDEKSAEELKQVAARRERLPEALRPEFDRRLAAEKRARENAIQARSRGLTPEANEYLNEQEQEKKSKKDVRDFNRQQADEGLVQAGKAVGAAAIGAFKGTVGAFTGSKAEQLVGQNQLGTAAGLGILPAPIAKLLAGAAGAVQAVKTEVSKPKQDFGSAQVLSGAESFHNYAQTMALDNDVPKEQLAAQKETNDKMGQAVEALKELVNKGVNRAQAVVMGRS